MNEPEILIADLSLFIDAMEPTTANDRFVVYADDSVIVVDPKDLQEFVSSIIAETTFGPGVFENQTIAVNPISLQNTVIAASSIETCDGWGLNPRTNRLVTVRDGLVSLLSLDSGLQTRQVEIPDLPDCLIGVSIDDEDRFLVLAASVPIDPDFEVTKTFHLDMSTGVILEVSGVESQEELSLTWSNSCSGCLICDVVGNSLARWTPGTNEVIGLEFADFPGCQRIGAEVDPLGRFVVQALYSETKDRFMFSRGVLSSSGISWQPNVELPPGEYAAMHCHPSKDLFLSHRFLDDEDFLCVINMAGELVASVQVPESCLGVDLIWTGDGNYVVAAGDTTVALWRALPAEN